MDFNRRLSDRDRRWHDPDGHTVCYFYREASCELLDEGSSAMTDTTFFHYATAIVLTMAWAVSIFVLFYRG